MHDIANREGATPVELRRAVQARAQTIVGEPSDEGVPEHLRAYVDKVARHAYKVTDEDIAALEAKHSCREIYELTVAAAIGASLARREAALATLKGAQS